MAQDPTVTIVLLVSREFLLDRLFERLKELKCDRANTNLLVLVDGDNQLYVKTRNLVVLTPFAGKICIKARDYGRRSTSQVFRRKQIARLHNEARERIRPCDYVFLIEDDGIIPINALEKLLEDFTIQPAAGFITGVELGRWLTPYIGGWIFDNPSMPKELRSVELHGTDELIQLHAAGLYCMLVKYELYREHNFWPGPHWGPDIAFGLELSKYMHNYMDPSIVVDHYRENGTMINLQNTEPKKSHYVYNRGTWRHSFSVLKGV